MSKNALPLPWLRPDKDASSQSTHLSLKAAASMFGRGRTTVFDDCQFLGIDTHKRGNGGCISMVDAWTLYLYYCWIVSKARSGDGRYHREGYWADISPSEEESPDATTGLMALRTSFMSEVGGSEADFRVRWEGAIAKANEKFFRGRENGQRKFVDYSYVA